MMQQIVLAVAINTQTYATSSAAPNYNTIWRVRLSCGHYVTHAGLLLVTELPCPECPKLTSATRKFFGLDR